MSQTQRCSIENGTSISLSKTRSFVTTFAKHPGSGRKRARRCVVCDGPFGHARNYCFASCFQRGRHLGPVLSHQVRALIGEGNQAYVDGNIPEAIRMMQEVIRIEPRAASAWSVIAQCYEDSSEPKKALQLRIMAAHLRHDADEWERLAAQSRWGRDRLSLKGTLTDGAFPQRFGIQSTSYILLQQGIQS